MGGPTGGDGSTGSSPRARGTAGHERAEPGVHGIIPACAGNSWRQALVPARNGDHPRVRGEQSALCSLLRWYSGSSPRARGTATSTVRSPKWTGIIPACAGNRGRCTRISHHSRDHPRVRGEQIISRYMREPSPGSSPRARGTEDDVPEFRITAGIIPACAGNR